MKLAKRTVAGALLALFMSGLGAGTAAADCGYIDVRYHLLDVYTDDGVNYTYVWGEEWVIGCWGGSAM